MKWLSLLTLNQASAVRICVRECDSFFYFFFETPCGARGKATKGKGGKRKEVVQEFLFRRAKNRATLRITREFARSTVSTYHTNLSSQLPLQFASTRDSSTEGTKEILAPKKPSVELGTFLSLNTVLGNIHICLKNLIVIIVSLTRRRVFTKRVLKDALTKLFAPASERKQNENQRWPKKKPLPKKPHGTLTQVTAQRELYGVPFRPCLLFRLAPSFVSCPPSLSFHVFHS